LQLEAVDRPQQAQRQHAHSTITPTTTCAATSHHMMFWRWATSWSVSVASKLSRRLATSWPSCSTGASRTTPAGSMRSAAR